MSAALLLAVLLALPARAAQPSGPALFEANGCAACHRIGSKGGNSGPDLSLVGFRRSKAWLETWLSSPKAWKHDTLMPEFKLDAPERGALVDYLSSLTEAPKLPKDGKSIFSKAGCVACHGAGGKGGHPNNNVAGGLIPALSKVAGTYTKDEMVKKISSGSIPVKADPAGPEPMVSMPKWSEKLTPEQISEVASYVLTLAEKTEDF